MAALHTALKALSPVDFTDVPTDAAQLDQYVADIFSQSQLIVESIPLAEPNVKDIESPSAIAASSAAEITLSTARSARPADEYVSLQKEWGKPIKLGAKENALGMSVYKASGKDGRGAWFARRSVHAGLGFSKFKQSMEQEFEESLAVQGLPGEGNIRGIGGEERVESIDVPGRGKLEVYRLSAQFPGPTTPRDFVTLLITSDNAMKSDQISTNPVPRHYMVISKPCNHPDTQPRDGFVRGSYESVEFIREVPRKLKTSLSTTDLETVSSLDKEDIGKTAVLRNAQQKSSTGHTRDRSITAPSHSATDVTNKGEDDESNPVEWIMVTRSDPGGSVPRFMVERGTPGSICQDAYKFLDWACKQDDAEEEIKDPLASTTASRKRPSVRRESFQSFRSSRLAGLHEPSSSDQAITEGKDATSSQPDEAVSSSGLLNTVVGTVSAYTPQVVLDHLPGHTTSTDSQQKEVSSTEADEVDDEDTKSILSTTSFQSAEDHLTSDDADERSVLSKESQGEENKARVQHEKELHKLEERRIALETKFAESRTKLEAQATDSTAKEEAAHKKALEKHDKELKKHEEKYRKEMEKLEERQRKERQKLEEKRKKQADKSEQDKLRRERDEARREAELAKKEADLLREVVADLQRQNTALVADLGKSGSPGSSRRVTIGSHSTLSQPSLNQDTSTEKPSE